jgi:hypothetical protein
MISRRVVLAALAALALACASAPVKPPVVTPEPAPPSPICWVDVQRGCDCWHMPPGQPWQRAIACQEPPVTLGPDCAPPESNLINGRWAPPKRLAAVTAAREKLGDPAGQAPQQTLGRLAAQLRADGYCAIAGQEAIFIKREDKLWEEHHSVDFGKGGWLLPVPAYKGVFTNTAEPGAEPTPEPPPAGASACGQPRPRKLVAWGMHPHVPEGFWDYSPITEGGEAGETGIEYCQAVGLGKMPDGVTPRSQCAVRVDLHPERVACEQLIVGGDPIVRCEQGAPEMRGPYLAACGNGSAWIEVCGRLPGAVCKRCPINDPSNCKNYIP